ncbi:MAG TPA: hypothetical protein VG826_28310 [Pirellulales bacterium]|nr:hypothetical protein [Pirellulales bacterium]
MSARSACLALTVLALLAANALAAGAAKPGKKSQPTRTAAKNVRPNSTAPSAATKAVPSKEVPPQAAGPKPTERTAEEAPQAGVKSYKLRYKFKSGETVRWEVEHRAKVRTTISASTQSDDSLSNTQTAETLSKSVKVWKVKSVDEQGNVTLVHSVEHVSMWQKFDGRQETRYDSDTDATPPVGYDNVAAAVGKPLAELTLDPRGAVVKREELFAQAAPLPENITLPLPENAVAVGDEWTMPADITVNVPPQNVTKRIKARQLYRLESVDDGIATIRLETQVLTPVNDPIIELQLAQSKANGTVRFDTAAGRVVSQESDVDEHVTGFQGPASNSHYVMRFSEKLLPDEKRAAYGPLPAARK